MSQRTSFCYDGEIDGDIAEWLENQPPNTTSKAIRAAIRLAMQQDHDSAPESDRLVRQLDALNEKMEALMRILEDQGARLAQLEACGPAVPEEDPELVSALDNLGV